MWSFSILFGIGTLLAGYPVAAQAESAKLKGAVLDELGRPLAGAQVVYSRKPTSSPQRIVAGRAPMAERPQSAKVAADALGRFELSQLQAGDYYLCMSAAGYLANCEWAQWFLSTVAKGEVRENGAVRLVKAAAVTFVINDPMSSLKGRGQPDPALLVGVRDVYGRLHPARETAVLGNRHTYQVDVPYGTALHVWLHSWLFFLTDSRGAALDPKGARVPFQAAVNGPTPSFTFNIAGAVKPQLP